MEAEHEFLGNVIRLRPIADDKNDGSFDSGGDDADCDDNRGVGGHEVDGGADDEDC